MQVLEAATPGVTRGAPVQPGRYNQQLSPQAILVEMGSTRNSAAEACASAILLAEAIAEVLK
jgi:stage II sporulation protein P